MYHDGPVTSDRAGVVMADYIRTYFGLTQERLASWLGVRRVALAQFEGGQRGWPMGQGLQPGVRDFRLTLAAEGLVYHPGEEPRPAPALPPAAPDAGPLLLRLAACQQQAVRLDLRWKAMQAQAKTLENRLSALPALRAYAGPVPDPAHETNWLALFENEAIVGLRYDCGPVPQALLLARRAGLLREAEELQAQLVALRAATPASPATPTT